MSWTQGGGSKGQTPWSAGSTRRRLAAGEAKRGGAGAGFTYRAPFGAPLGSMDSWEWAAASGAGSWVRGRRKRRRRRVWRRPELGEVGVGARGHGRSHGWARSAPGRVLSTLPCSGVSYGGSSTVCVIAGGEERSAPTARVVRGRGRARRERGNGQGLTVSSKRRSACSGRRWRRRINGGGGRSPRWKTTVMAMFRALPACVAHRR